MMSNEMPKSFILSNTIMVAQYGAQNGSCILKNSHFASEGYKNCQDYADLR